MNIQTLENPQQSLINFLDDQIIKFNLANREINDRKPLAVQIKNDRGDIIAGAAGRTFGRWLQLNTLWVSESMRGKNLGSQILSAIEVAAKTRGCDQCLLETLNFQAMPFYKKHGYEIQWTQENYPKTGCKYFMLKTL
jgi:ribosomal protein S18 acetylase RimI-like enzyme